MLDAKTSIAPPKPNLKSKTVVSPVVSAPPASPSRHCISETEILSSNLTKQVAKPVSSISKPLSELSETLPIQAGKKKLELSSESSDDDESEGVAAEAEGEGEDEDEGEDDEDDENADAEDEERDSEADKEGIKAITGDIQLASDSEADMDVDESENVLASLPVVAVSEPLEDKGMFYFYLACIISYLSFRYYNGG